MERLQKIIAQAGICSRRKAEELILAKRVEVDGKIIDQLGYKVKSGALVKVDGNIINKEEHVVYLLNKPKNIISSVSDDRGRVTVCDIIESPYRLFPVGRLDFDSSGLIIMTNDGALANRLIHPKFKIPKTYEVTINRLLDEEDRLKLKKGIRVDDYTTAPCKIEILASNKHKNTSKLKMTIYEGHNRQIRKMFETLNYKVIRLHRIAEANLILDNLRPGEYRRLKPIEVLNLRRYLDSFNN